MIVHPISPAIVSSPAAPSSSSGIGGGGGGSQSHKRSATPVLSVTSTNRSRKPSELDRHLRVNTTQSPPSLCNSNGFSVLNLRNGLSPARRSLTSSFARPPAVLPPDSPLSVSALCSPPASPKSSDEVMSASSPPPPPPPPAAAVDFSALSQLSTTNSTSSVGASSFSSSTTSASFSSLSNSMPSRSSSPFSPPLSSSFLSTSSSSSGKISITELKPHPTPLRGDAIPSVSDTPQRIKRKKPCKDSTAALFAASCPYPTTPSSSSSAATTLSDQKLTDLLLRSPDTDPAYFSRSSPSPNSKVYNDRFIPNRDARIKDLDFRATEVFPLPSPSIVRANRLARAASSPAFASQLPSSPEIVLTPQRKRSLASRAPKTPAQQYSDRLADALLAAENVSTSSLLSFKKKPPPPSPFYPLGASSSGSSSSSSSRRFSPDKVEPSPFMSADEQCFHAMSQRRVIADLAMVSSHGIPRTPKPSNISLTPERMLDSPDLLDDYYLNVLDWSLRNEVAVALSGSIYMWNAENGNISKFLELEDLSRGQYNISSYSYRMHPYVSSLKFNGTGRELATGTSAGDVLVWDVHTQKLIRTYRAGDADSSARIAALDYNPTSPALLTAGYRDASIITFDTRIGSSSFLTAFESATTATSHRFMAHTQEICGLRWSPDGQYLASGSNDNSCCVWELNARGSTSSASSTPATPPPRHCFRDSVAAVKALAWAPFQRHLLTTGAGSADRCIRFYNTSGRGEIEQTVDSKSQVCSLVWSRNAQNSNVNRRELMSAHGYSRNQLTLWRYPSMHKVCDLVGHTSRVLHMVGSPDGTYVCSAGSDETLRFWKVWDSGWTPASPAVPSPHSAKRRKEGIELLSMSSLAIR